MREIKYRGWFIKSKIMAQITDLFWQENKLIYVRGHYKYGSICQGSIGGHSEYVDLEKELTLLQFTDLHDRNKKEIYGDDIIKYFDKNGNFLNLHVLLKHGCWIAEFKSKDYICGECESNSGFWFLYQIAEKSEIIGNIHENPEQLEEK